MDLLTLFLIALGLSMDAFAVSVSNGLCYKNFGKKQIIYSSLTFGIFQGIMPILGYFAGTLFSDSISFLDHWIALLLLGYIGGNMIYESIKEIKENKAEKELENTYNFKTLMIQGIATSIDALAVGISFAIMKINIYPASSFITAVTFICCLLGSALGKRFGSLLKEKAKILGGIILIGIGLKIFISHSLGI